MVEFDPAGTIVEFRKKLIDGGFSDAAAAEIAETYLILMMDPDMLRYLGMTVAGAHTS